MDLTVLPVFAVRYEVVAGTFATTVAANVVTVRARDEEHACAVALAYVYDHDPHVLGRPDPSVRILDVGPLPDQREVQALAC